MHMLQTRLAELLSSNDARDRDMAYRLARQQEGGKNGGSIKAAKSLARAHGFTIQRDRQGGWWVTCPASIAEADDPLEGNRFCTSGQEVLEAARVYEAYLKGRK